MEHPYVPRDLQLPGYVPVSLSQSTIVGVYGLSLSSSSRLSGCSPGDRATYRNSIGCSCAGGLSRDLRTSFSKVILHSLPNSKDKTGFYLAEVWKEYSKGDSRYAGRDSAIVAVEGMTAVLEGPPCLLAVYAIAKGKGYSYILQFAISLGQLYGTFVYFITAILEGDNFSASPFYYYAYYVLANSFWILIPSLIAIRCWKKICLAVQSQSQKKAHRESTGTVSSSDIGIGEDPVGAAEEIAFCRACARFGLGLYLYHEQQ
ncbi:putative 3-beta-hydroxysteroid-Delta(8),Delta(7)-isomerase [Hibiscus syriacus]|uniref:3-beta-hydroxysteroid-Delta(8),Delta(7)-isomerase n=1 Tax=Hibiscus syriacus TaxID=106335 RepID=A0A6A3BM71_HIBSY|nr:putative 3-beta-hydroxysteroid-Delta(8),Delta(7)-isomerase [Hibiscus syriacus]